VAIITSCPTRQIPDSAFSGKVNAIAVNSALAFTSAAFSYPAPFAGKPRGALRRCQRDASAPRAAGRAARAAKSEQMASTTTNDAEQFERFLLRRGVGALQADRDRCVDCGRTPLTGEHVHLYDERGGGVVCELCRTLRREPPVASEIVRHCEHGQTVRLTARAA
jgi:hypothetical protein